MRPATLISRAGAGLVAGVAGFASYQHIYHVATAAGEHASVAAVLPLSADGLIVVATAALVDDKRNRRQPRLSARVGLMAGIAATLAANIISTRPDLLDDPSVRMAVAGWPAVAFLLSVEILTRRGTPRQHQPDMSPPDVDMSPHNPDTVPDTVPDVFPARPDHVPPTGRRWRRGELTRQVQQAVDECADLTPEHLAEVTGGSLRHVRRILDKIRPTAVEVTQ
ncbi:hypothetical protein C5N14_30830 [Micromonospora sp. MW-13]|uniref:DUF2637 domain-containing protein n=1 Tax=Micromonospora sp. MW-13 TaxID=2094022 RepID=UPI000E447743|nr:DUF2637 domain-containing protein [Micromonospora sp. MW-13]RGC64988.1 hypothetical protein C5N14_30830 [Micromonospora sp. MW-13]